MTPTRVYRRAAVLGALLALLLVAALVVTGNVDPRDALPFVR